MVGIDVFLEPLAVFVDSWFWHIDGAYFGIPFTNFLGWFLSGYITHIIYLFFEKPCQTVDSNILYILEVYFILYSTVFTAMGLIKTKIYIHSIIPFIIALFILLPFWVFAFFINSNNRKNILLTSLVCAPVGPLSEFWNLKDYWSPTYLFKITIGQWVFGIEDYIFAFAFSGICYGIYILITKRIGSYEEKKYTWFVSVKLMIIGIIFFVLLFMLTYYL